MYRDEKTQGLQQMILFLELFVNVKRFSFRLYQGAWNEKEFLNVQFSFVAFCFKAV